jgi:hypothetical protein
MEAMHGKENSEVPCQAKNPRDSFLKDFKVERILDRTQRIESGACASAHQRFLSRDR